LKRLSRVESMIATGKAGEAAAELEAEGAALGRHGRLLLTKALNELGDWPKLERHLANPESAEEITLLVEALIRQKRWQEAKDILAAPAARDLLSAPNIKDLEQRVRAEEAMSI